MATTASSDFGVRRRRARLVGSRSAPPRPNRRCFATLPTEANPFAMAAISYRRAFSTAPHARPNARSRVARIPHAAIHLRRHLCPARVSGVRPWSANGKLAASQPTGARDDRRGDKHCFRLGRAMEAVSSPNPCCIACRTTSTVDARGSRAWRGRRSGGGGSVLDTARRVSHPCSRRRSQAHRRHCRRSRETRAP